MATFTNQTKNSETFANLNKNSSTFSNSSSSFEPWTYNEIGIKYNEVGYYYNYTPNFTFWTNQTKN